MRVKLILPALQEAAGKFFRPIKYSLFPPLGLAQLAAYLDPADEIRILDQHVEEDDFSDSPDLVVIQTYITNARRAYAIADSYRSRRIYVVMGGLHATSLPEEALAHADTVITGPAHEAWQIFLRKFRRGEPCRGIIRDPVRTLASLPFPRRDLICRKHYLVPNSIVVSRGCPSQCEFCYTRNFFAGGTSFYTEPVDRALAEIETLPGRHLFFLDDNLFGSSSFSGALFEGMRGMKRRFQGAATTAGVLNRELVRKAADAGLKSLFIGFESLNPASLLACRKTQNRIEEYNTVVKILRDHGIMTNASFVFGLPGDDADVFDRTVDWAVSQGIETATFHLATPYPGTPFFEKMEREGRLLTRDWDLYDTRHAVIRHDHLTPAQLEEGYWRSYERFYRWRSIFRGAGVKNHFSGKMRHIFYTGAWKKIDPLWHCLIRLRSLPCCSRILEKVLDMA